MEQELELTHNQELLSTIIRTETALRYPIHNLSSADPITIEIKTTDANGATSFHWEVTYNNKYGQPGRLAYKLDTVVINRRIDEARGQGLPVPKILRLGSLRDIASEVGTGEGNTNAIKRALRQNAFAGLTVKGLHYRASDRSEKTFEFSDTRYGVVFRGESLPNGTTSDSVYVVFHDLYLALLNSAMRRPLDYDYLKALSPTEQRLYEILSFQMVPALKHKQRAKLRYSEYCLLSTQVRHFDLRRVRDQMRVVHRPHIASGYIQRDPEFQATTDADGQPDWFIFYTPGAKAEADQLAFDFVASMPPRRREPLLESPPRRSTPPEPKAPAPRTETRPLDLFSPPSLPSAAEPDAETLARHFYQLWSKSGPHALLTAGDHALAEELLRSYALEEAKAIVALCVTHARTAYPGLVTFGGARSLMGIAIASYQEKKAERERVRQRQQTKAFQQAQEAHRTRFQPIYDEYVRRTARTLCEADRGRGEEYAKYREAERKRVCQGIVRPDGPIGRSLLQTFDAAEQEARRISAFFETKVLDFWEWDAAENPDALQKP